MKAKQPIKNAGKCLLLAGAALTTISAASAQNFTMDWSTIDGGGGSGSGGVYTLQGTVGQSDAGTMSGGNYELVGGFWGVVTAVQTPGAPLLSILSIPGGVRISWPSSSTGFVLQQNGDMNSQNWVNVPVAPADDGSNKSVLVTPATGNLFFRLRK